MTMSNERTRALLMAGELLRELRSGDLTLEEARRQANVVLRHFPNAGEINRLAKRDNSMPYSMLEPLPTEKDAS